MAFAQSDLAAFRRLPRARRDLEPPQRRPPRRDPTRGAAGSWHSSPVGPADGRHAAGRAEALMGKGKGPRGRRHADERPAPGWSYFRRPADEMLVCAIAGDRRASLT